MPTILVRHCKDSLLSGSVTCIDLVAAWYQSIVDGGVNSDMTHIVQSQATKYNTLQGASPTCSVPLSLFTDTLHLDTSELLPWCCLAIWPVSSASSGKVYSGVRVERETLLVSLYPHFVPAGVNTVLFVASMVILLFYRRTRGTNKIILSLSIFLFLVCTTHFAIEFNHFYITLVSLARV